MITVLTNQKTISQWVIRTQGSAHDGTKAAQENAHLPYITLSQGPIQASWLTCRQLRLLI